MGVSPLLQANYHHNMKLLTRFFFQPSYPWQALKQSKYLLGLLCILMKTGSVHSLCRKDGKRREVKFSHSCLRTMTQDDYFVLAILLCSWELNPESREFYLLWKISTTCAMPPLFLFLFCIILTYILIVHKKGFHFLSTHICSAFWSNLPHCYSFLSYALLFPSTSLVIPIVFVLFCICFYFPQLPHIRENVWYFS